MGEGDVELPRKNHPSILPSKFLVYGTDNDGKTVTAVLARRTGDAFFAAKDAHHQDLSGSCQRRRGKKGGGDKAKE